MEVYPTAILFPIVLGESGLDPAETCNDTEEESPAHSLPEEENTEAAEPVGRKRRYIPPSSAGFSFFIRGNVCRFQVIYSAVRYERQGERDEEGRFKTLEHKRIELGGEVQALTFDSSCLPHKKIRQRKHIFENRAGIDVLWRPFQQGWIVTVTMFNQQEVDETQGQSGRDSGTYWQQLNEKSLFEVGLRCFIEAGNIGEYPRVDWNLLGPEEIELEFRYRKQKIYAVGHGAAADWVLEQGQVREIMTDFIPAVEVPQVTAHIDGLDSTVMEFAFLASEHEGVSRWDRLDGFVVDYAKWILSQQQEAKNLNHRERQIAETIIKRMTFALNRMRQGVELLRTDSIAARAFSLTNQAMLDQMVQDALISGRQQRNFRWRPFQLAFLLMTIKSVVDEDDEFRDIVDLIWFPTGGGKTEAYLGLIAFLVLWRRMKFPASYRGTVAIMRYTLRLLTVQQFQRAARLICAMELIRRKRDFLGSEPFTIGLWIGASISPNHCAKAAKAVKQAAHHNRACRKLVLTSCPWCGKGFSAHGSYRATDQGFHFRCLNTECEFGKDRRDILPCNVVDEELYRNPPTLLISTVDKFAQLAWEEKTAHFFGRKSRAPELIIQDELHLISSALGSIVGLYEAAIHTILTHKRINPKYIASTATIRMAEQQVRRLYGRQLAIFPPPGLTNEDSYFARTVAIDDQHPGRLYAGYLAPMLNRQQSMAPLAAALYVAPEAVFDQDQQDRDSLTDAWWTAVVYHGSLRGVENSHNAYVHDVSIMVERYKNFLKEGRGHQRGIRISRQAPRPVQLTSRSTAEQNAKTFAALKKNRNEKGCIDAVLCTNMISVGLDVDRLALMIINGQPLTTAEYIQASSRVGRAHVPGLVFVNYYRDQARSLSHYENFRPYHESFYRFVEPTSVTPFTYQARTRALHAALVIAVRHSCAKMTDNNMAGNFNAADPEIQSVIECLKRRCAMAATGSNRDNTLQHIDRLVEEWHSRAEECRNRKRRLCYQVPKGERGQDHLLYSYESSQRSEKAWQTLLSMRNVEESALLKLL